MKGEGPKNALSETGGGRGSKINALSEMGGGQGGPKKCVVRDRRREGQQKLMRCPRWEEGREGPKNALSGTGGGRGSKS